ESWEGSLASCESSTYAGFSDWKLPNKKELMSLVNYDRVNPATDFPNGLEGDFQSSSSPFSVGVWMVNFSSGRVWHYMKYETIYRSFLCVRSGENENPDNNDGDGGEGVTLNGQAAVECNECEACYDIPDACAKDQPVDWCFGVPCCDGSIRVDGSCHSCPDGHEPNDDQTECVPQCPAGDQVCYDAFVMNGHFCHPDNEPCPASGPPVNCVEHTDCPAGNLCVLIHQECLSPCESSADCAGDFWCDVVANFCFPYVPNAMVESCNPNGACDDPGQTCVAKQECRASCTNDGECDGDLVCNVAGNFCDFDYTFQCPEGDQVCDDGYGPYCYLDSEPCPDPAGCDCDNDSTVCELDANGNECGCDPECNLVACPPEDFACDDGGCVPHANVCNGNEDCADGSDEHGDCPEPEGVTLNGQAAVECNECEACDNIANACAKNDLYPGCHVVPCCDGSKRVNGSCQSCPEGYGSNDDHTECFGIPGADCGYGHVIDVCGACGGDGTSCLDCAGVPYGESSTDDCGFCDADPSNDNLSCCLCDQALGCECMCDPDCYLDTCVGGDFSCGDGHCISGTKECDGTPQCMNGSDELNCSPAGCSADEFACDGECFPNEYKCDNEPDCSDESDELNCTCSADDFDCG
ncbi:MAG TPA: DUF1566 domain-containing protein, partial [Myxococcales bacterium]|nr:DUF1566 domain-containing protein [Myxococcales bacterium]